MSTFDIPPSQQFRSPLGTEPGVPGPLAAPASEPAPPLDFGGAPELPPLPPAGGDSEVDILKSLVVGIGDYKSLPSVTEQERAQIGQAEVIVQRLLAANEKLADSAMGTTTANRKLFAG